MQTIEMKRIADTEYRLIAQIIKEFGQDVPATGLPTDEVYNIFFNILSKGSEKILILILDEIDQLINKAGDDVIYSLIRMNSEINNVQLSLIGISNNAAFTEAMDPRVKSSLSEEDVLFPPYNALQIKDILKSRAEIAFFDNVLENGVIEKCAAIAAREHGDARRALELLRVAGEIAERNSLSKVRLDHLDEAEERIEKERILDIVRAQPKQSLAVLYSILVGFFFYRELTVKNLWEIFKKSVVSTGSILIIVGVSYLFGWIIAQSNIANKVGELILSISKNPNIVLLEIMIFFLIVGMLMDPLAALIIFVPILLPIVNSIGIHPVHFGLITVLNLMIGLLTPPIGYLLYVTASISGEKVERIIQESLPFISALLIVLLICIFWPSMVMYLPNLVGR